MAQPGDNTAGNLEGEAPVSQPEPAQPVNTTRARLSEVLNELRKGKPHESVEGVVRAGQEKRAAVKIDHALVKITTEMREVVGRVRADNIFIKKFGGNQLGEDSPDGNGPTEIDKRLLIVDPVAFDLLCGTIGHERTHKAGVEDEALTRAITAQYYDAETQREGYAARIDRIEEVAGYFSNEKDPREGVLELGQYAMERRFHDMHEDFVYAYALRNGFSRADVGRVMRDYFIADQIKNDDGRAFTEVADEATELFQAAFPNVPMFREDINEPNYGSDSDAGNVVDLAARRVDDATRSPMAKTGIRPGELPVANLDEMRKLKRREAGGAPEE